MDPTKDGSGVADGDGGQGRVELEGAEASGDDERDGARVEQVGGGSEDGRDEAEGEVLAVDCSVRQVSPGASHGPTRGRTDRDPGARRGERVGLA